MFYSCKSSTTVGRYVNNCPAVRCNPCNRWHCIVVLSCFILCLCLGCPLMWITGQPFFCTFTSSRQRLVNKGLNYCCAQVREHWLQKRIVKNDNMRNRRQIMFFLSWLQRDLSPLAKGTAFLSLLVVVFYSFCCRCYPFFWRPKEPKTPAHGKSSPPFLCSRVASNIPRSKRCCHLNLPFALRRSGTCAIWCYK